MVVETTIGSKVEEEDDDDDDDDETDALNGTVIVKDSPSKEERTTTTISTTTTSTTTTSTTMNRRMKKLFSREKRGKVCEKRERDDVQAGHFVARRLEQIVRESERKREKNERLERYVE